MLKKREKLIIQLLVLVMCTSLIPITMAFASTRTTVEVSKNELVNSDVINQSDFIFDSRTGTITDYKGSDAEVVIPSTINGVKVKSIGYEVFRWYSRLTSIKIPDSVTNIGVRAFYGCDNLKSITIPNSVTSIGDSAFNGCTSLKSITISNRVTSIGRDAFDGCTSLTSITIPNSVTSIGDGAFGECNNASFYVQSDRVKQLLINGGADNSKIILNTKPSTVSVTRITLNKTSLSVVKGKTSTLTVKVAPSTATNKAVTWSSSNAKVATVDANGKITGVAKGTANITCTTKDGSKKIATCKVTVTNPIIITSIKLNKTSLSVAKGKTSTLTATALPSTATNKAVTWKSSNAKIVTVDANGKITGVSKGTATITCTAKDGSKKIATCKVTVN